MATAAGGFTDNTARQRRQRVRSESLGPKYRTDEQQQNEIVGIEMIPRIKQGLSGGPRSTEWARCCTRGFWHLDQPESLGGYW